jgi:ferrochelatase
MMQVARHYDLFDGVSPINEQNRKLIAALKLELEQHGPNLPIYWGNRNWHPLLADTVKQMAEDGIRNALAFVTSAYSSYSSCRQYLENIETARETVGSAAPRIEKIRAFYNHPGFIEANAVHLAAALDQIPSNRRATTRIAFTAHSIPKAMADNCAYESQLLETSELVAQAVDHEEWKLVFQSRSGPPSQPWLEPDVCDYLKELKLEGVTDVVIAPIGFVSDHMEVVYDLDTEARSLANELSLNMIRSATAGTHPAFVGMIRELIVERMDTGLDNGSACGFEGCCPKGELARPGGGKPQR